MRAFFAVTRREFFERPFVFAAAGVAAVVPFLIPIATQLSGDSASLARHATAALLATVLGGGLAVGLGASVFATGSANQRLGFYLAKPISTWALWTGKVTGSLAVVGACFAIVLIPTLIAGGGASPLRDLAGNTPQGLGIELFLLALLFLVAHAAATIVRSRSPIVAVDLVAAAIIVLTGVVVASRLVSADFPRSHWIAPALCLLALAIFVAGHRALARGRIDFARTHRTFSASLWSIAALSATAFAAYAAWVLGAPPSALSAEWTQLVGPNGWVVASGRARGGWVQFLYDTRTGDFERILGSPVSSRDGSVAIWVDGKQSGPWTVRLRNLARRNPSIETGFQLSTSRWAPLLVSADGRRAGAIESGILSVVELPSGRSLGSVKLGDLEHYTSAGFFVTPDLVRVYRSGRTPASRLEILEFDLRKRSLETTGEIENAGDSRLILMSRSGDRIAVREVAPPRLTLRDGHSGALVAVLRDESSGSVVFLADGRVVVSGRGAVGRSLTVFSAAGARQGAIDLSGDGILRLGSEVSPGRLAFGWTAQPPHGDTKEPVLEVADVDRLDARPVAAGLAPITRWWEGPPPPPGSEATKLFRDSDKNLVRFDPATGERRLVLGRR